MKGENEKKAANLDPDSLASPPSNSAGRNAGEKLKNNPNHEQTESNPVKSDPDTGKNVDSFIVRQPSGSVKSTNSSVSNVSGSNKTSSDLNVNPRLSKNNETFTNGNERR